MNYKVIQLIVEEYSTSKNRRIRNQLFDDLLDEYKPLITTFIMDLPENPVTIREDFRQFYSLRLLEAICNYDSSSSQFGTYWYYRSKNLKKDFYRETSSVINHEKAKKYRTIEKFFVTDDTEIDNTKITDMNIDMNKILSPKEKLIMNAYISGKIKKYVPYVDPIINKLTSYIRD